MYVHVVNRCLHHNSIRTSVCTSMSSARDLHSHEDLHHNYMRTSLCTSMTSARELRSHVDLHHTYVILHVHDVNRCLRFGRVHQTNHSWGKHPSETHPSRGHRALWAFPSSTIPSRTELNWTDCYEGEREQTLRSPAVHVAA